MIRKRIGSLSLLLGLAFGLLPLQVVWAGASPSQWVVVVNGGSVRSRTIANHYTHWRNIPGRNVIVLNDIPEGVTIPLADFKEKILIPVLTEIGKRNLTPFIQGIAYSSDFPLAINMESEAGQEGALAMYMTKVGSINGLTYLYRFVRDFGNSINLQNNWYVGRPPHTLFGSPIGDNNGEVEKKKRKLLDEKDFSSLAFFLEEQLSKFPDQYPIAYQTAQAWAEAGQSSKALQALERAIDSGWSYSQFMGEDEHLQSLREFTRYQTLAIVCEDDPFDWTPAIGFDARRRYAPNGVFSVRPDDSAGVTYMLSMVLAVCGPTGNTEQEALDQLKRSIDADYSHPKGSVFFTKTADIRTECREPAFILAVDKLTQLGLKGEIIPDAIPRGYQCTGVTMGAASFSWAASKSTLVPGAIGDNLTSLGGAMDQPHQTKLTEFLRHGAAAASGTVTEPYSIQAKFPHPTIHAYYGAGLTCAEAFYSSVAGPYQLLIAGDPLCQPYARAPRFLLEGVEDGAPLPETLLIGVVPDTSPITVPPRLLGVHINGEFKGVQILPQGEKSKPQVRMGAANFTTGAHEVRLIAGDGGRLGTRFERSFWVVSGPDYNQIKLSGPSKWNSSGSEPLRVKVLGSDSDATIEIRHGFESVYTVSEGQNTCELPFEKLGRGPVKLQAVATIGTSEVASLPITINIE